MRSFLRQVPVILLSILPVSVLSSDVLSTDGFSMCSNDASIKVEALNVSYNRKTRLLTFDVAGSSTQSQNVTLSLVVTAYGQQVYSKDFNPCENVDSTLSQYTSASNAAVATDAIISNMCPIPVGSFSSQGQETVPEQYASQIPSIAFAIPDLDGLVKLQVKSQNSSSNIACIQSDIGNGHTINTPAIQYAAAGMAAAALGVSAIAAVAAGGGVGGGGGAGPSPSFSEVIGWFQGMATSGMLSVQYPKVYQSFTTNFAFSTGLIPWPSLQRGIDGFRASTGGNLTDDSWDYLRNATLVYDNDAASSNVTKRALKTVVHWVRDGATVNLNGTTTDVNGGSGPSNNGTSTVTKAQHYVSGIEAYVEQLSIPKSNTFMTVLVVWAILVAAIVVLILGFKLILELLAMFGQLSKYFESWRKRYWMRMAKAITNLIMLLYGIWTLYCVYQFTEGDSWAAKLLAGVTLALFTAVLAFFTFKIVTTAKKVKNMEGGAEKLYVDKETWIRYSLFYDSFQRGYWWFFIPTIFYLFARGVIVAGANGHGMAQVAGQLIVEGLMLILLLWTRPYERKSGKWINITIHVVRVLSIICIMVFVEELGISQTTKTITGVILIVIQTVLTVVLGLLILINTIISLFKENPHAKSRREAAKMQNKDIDDLTPLDARNSLLLESMDKPGSHVTVTPFGEKAGHYDHYLDRSMTNSPPDYYHHDEENQHLVSAAAPMTHYRDHSRSPSVDSREPRLPDLNFGRAL